MDKFSQKKDLMDKLKTKIYNSIRKLKINKQKIELYW